MVIPVDPLCERARCLASLRVDGEATEFESTFLHSHLATCAGCREHAGRLEASTALIRATPLAEPVAFALPTHRRRFHGVRHLQAAAAALVVLGAGLTGIAGIPRSEISSTGPSNSRPAYLDSASYEQKVLSRLSTRPAPARWPGLKQLAN